MKKLLALILALIMSLSLVACGGGEGEGEAEGEGEVTYKDTINVAMDVDAESYNPVEYNNTTAARVAQLLREGSVDAVTFSASSTVRNFFSLLEGQLEEGESVPTLMKDVAALSIGTITSNTMKDLGLTVAAEADPFTIPGLVQAARDYFA